MGMFGGDWLGQMINGHPMEAFGQNSKIAQAIDGQPAAILGMNTGGGDKTSAPAPSTSGSTGAPGISPAVAGLGAAAALNATNNAASDNPLTPQSVAPTAPTANFGNTNNPQANNPLQTTQPSQQPDQFAGTPFSAQAAPTVMARIQHPQFQSFLQSLGSYQ